MDIVRREFALDTWLFAPLFQPSVDRLQPFVRIVVPGIVDGDAEVPLIPKDFRALALPVSKFLA